MNQQIELLAATIGTKINVEYILKQVLKL